MDVSNLELALVSTLKQQGKSGEQSGVVLRTLFTKLMSVAGGGANAAGVGGNGAKGGIGSGGGGGGAGTTGGTGGQIS